MIFCNYILLLQLGIEAPFSNSADFSGISETEPLKIDEIIQKTFINVTEDGTEAAAATAGKCLLYFFVTFQFM